LTVEALPETLREMLSSYGVDVGESMVMDPQNEPFPVQVQRQVGGMQVYEIQEVNYPFFVDIRSNGMGQNPIVSSLPAVTLHWASPLTIDEEKNANRDVAVLLQSTDQSWLRTSTDVQPNPQLYPEFGFPVEGEQQSWPLAVAIRGSFDSYFKDRASPFQTEESATEPMTATQELPLGTIESSPESARLVVIGSTEFIDDAVLQISTRLSADRYLNNLQFVQNTVDWSVEDEDLLTIRSRGTQARLLKPLDSQQQSMWEGVNYGVALLALIVIGGVWSLRRRSEEPMVLVDDEPDLETGASPEPAPLRLPENKQDGGSDE
jgi:ABC-2 type transport system permease protein